MSATLKTAAPVLTRPGAPSRSSRLLGLIRKLIAFGHMLTQALTENPAGTVDGRTAHEFGTPNLHLILQRIRLGLTRAAALEARVEKQAAKLDQTPLELPRLPSLTSREPSGEPRVEKPAAAPADAVLAAMPSVEEIARQVNRRSIGAVLADICRDLGIGMGHPLWSEVHGVLLDNGATSSMRLMREQVDRKLAWDEMQAVQGGGAVAVVAEPACAATGPP